MATYTKRIETLENRVNAMEGKLDQILTLLAKQKGESIEAPKKTKTEKNSQSKSSKTATKSATKSVKDFEPKKDENGFYIWASYKAQRRAFVEFKTGKTLHGKDGSWLDGEAFKKAAAPFDKQFKYVKKADR